MNFFHEKILKTSVYETIYFDHHTYSESKIDSTADSFYSCPTIEFELFCDLEEDGTYETCLGTGVPGSLTDAGEWF